MTQNLYKVSKKVKQKKKERNSSNFASHYTDSQSIDIGNQQFDQTMRTLSTIERAFPQHARVRSSSSLSEV